MPYGPNDFKENYNDMMLFQNVKEDSWELHFPGQRYTGPGTHIFNNIGNLVMPRNKTDAVTLMHDIDYVLTGKPGNVISEYKAIKADYNAWKNADYSLAGIATQLGLGLRSGYSLPFHGSDNEQLGYKLKQFVKQSPSYMRKFEEYGLKDVLLNW